LENFKKRRNLLELFWMSVAFKNFVEDQYLRLWEHYPEMEARELEVHLKRLWRWCDPETKKMYASSVNDRRSTDILPAGRSHLRSGGERQRSEEEARSTLRITTLGWEKHESPFDQYTFTDPAFKISPLRGEEDRSRADEYSFTDPALKTSPLRGERDHSSSEEYIFTDPALKMSPIQGEANDSRADEYSFMDPALKMSPLRGKADRPRGDEHSFTDPALKISPLRGKEDRSRAENYDGSHVAFENSPLNTLKTEDERRNIFDLCYSAFGNSTEMEFLHCYRM
jgi:hypothetical protein